jgi:hypothetical protein
MQEKKNIVVRKKKHGQKLRKKKKTFHFNVQWVQKTTI